MVTAVFPHRSKISNGKYATFWQHIQPRILSAKFTQAQHIRGAKKEAEAQAEAEALHDTDVSGLARKDDFDETAYEDRILRENE